MKAQTQKILVGDVGGTNVRLGLAFRAGDKTIKVEQIRKLPGDDYASLEQAISYYLSGINEKPAKAAIALAGPLSNGCVELTNRNWTVCENKLADVFKFKHVYLYNDFAAMARAVPECQNGDLDCLNAGNALEGKPILVAGPGTGFGMAILVPINGGWKVISSEGGHIAYAPRSKKETEILHIMQKKHGFVSLELVSSGSGMDGVHQAVCERLGQAYKKLDPARVRDRALAGDQACLDVCEIRAGAIMGAIGDIALAAGTRGGIVMAGGVTNRLMEFINTPKAMSRYFDRGPRSDYVKNIPIWVMQKKAAALYGVAALCLDEDNG